MTRTPSMDNKDEPSPPGRTHERYEADKEAGRHPYGKAYDRVSWELHVAACRKAGLDPEEAPAHYHERGQG